MRPDALSKRPRTSIRCKRARWGTARYLHHCSRPRRRQGCRPCPGSSRRNGFHGTLPPCNRRRRQGRARHTCRCPGRCGHPGSHRCTCRRSHRQRRCISRHSPASKHRPAPGSTPPPYKWRTSRCCHRPRSWYRAGKRRNCPSSPYIARTYSRAGAYGVSCAASAAASSGSGPPRRLGKWSPGPPQTPAAWPAMPAAIAWSRRWQSRARGTQNGGDSQRTPLPFTGWSAREWLVAAFSLSRGHRYFRGLRDTV